MGSAVKSYLLKCTCQKYIYVGKSNEEVVKGCEYYHVSWKRIPVWNTNIQKNMNLDVRFFLIGFNILNAVVIDKG